MVMIVSGINNFQAQAEHSILQEVSSLRNIFCAKKLSVRHVSLPHDDDGARIVSELVEVVLSFISLSIMFVILQYTANCRRYALALLYVFVPGTATCQNFRYSF